MGSSLARPTRGCGTLALQLVPEDLGDPPECLRSQLVGEVGVGAPHMARLPA